MLPLPPNGDFGRSRFNDNYILRELTRLRNRHNVSVCLEPEDWNQQLHYGR